MVGPQHANPDAGPVVKPAAVAAAAFLAATLLIFLAYRVAFLALFAPSAAFGQVWTVYLAGARLDAALVAIELVVLLLVFLLFRWFRLRAFLLALLLLTVLHILLSIANLIFFNERYQHIWEMLIANLTRPGEIFVAIEPFLETYPLQLIAGIALAIPVVIVFVRLCRRIPVRNLDLWNPRRHLRWSLALMLLLVFTSLDPVAYQTTRYWRQGWIPMPTASQFYMRHESYQVNQAVINPFHDLVRFYVPAIFAGSGGKADRTDPAVAVALAQSLLGIPPTDARYPLLQKLPPGPQLGLKNVIVLVVEGLSRSVLHRTESGQEITPFLNDLSKRGLYFPNIIQSYNATDGSIFSIVTGLHKSYLNQHWQYFLPTEVNGYFGSIAYLLGQENYKHLAMFGFHNRREDFAGFLRNQGFNTLDFPYFSAALGAGRNIHDVSNALGMFDHVLFDEAHKVLAGTRPPFTAMVVTGTTHSPWTTPKILPRVFRSNALNTFRYLDNSIREFVEKLRQSLNGLDDTLLVITGDHTSVVFGEGGMEQLRVPLIFYNPRLEARASQFAPMLKTSGSHVDILPTVLQLLDGAHRYSGMGVSLISENRSNSRIISSNRFSSLYFKGDHALQYSPSTPGVKGMQLFAIKDGDIVATDVSSSERALMATMQREFLALYESSARLAKDKRIIPMRE